MKTWVWLLVAVLCGYFVYSWWFRPDVEEREALETPPVLEVPKEPAAEPEPDLAPSPSRRIDLARGRAEPPAVEAEDPAVKALDNERLIAVRKGDTKRAEALTNQILKEHPHSDAARWIHFERGKAALARYREIGLNKQGLQHAVEAWKHLTPVLFLRDPDAGSKEALTKELRKLAHDVLFRGRHIEGVNRLYTPRSGDNLSTLRRKKFKAWGALSSPGFIAAVNGMSSPKALRAGEAIRVPLGEPLIIVVKREFRLYFMLDGKYVADFPIGLGKEGSTPEAEFVIEDKNPFPDWYPRPGVKIPYGDPRNILGTRWMAFKDSPEYDGFGIHGTADPRSIGKEESSGCIRMRKADVEKLFDWTPIGTRVIIRR